MPLSALKKRDVKYGLWSASGFGLRGPCVRDRVRALCPVCVAGLSVQVALRSNFGPVVLMDFGPPPGPSTLRSPRLNRGTWRGLESQNGFVRATASGA